MTFRVNDQVTAAIFIAGREFPLDVGNGLRSLHIRASSLQSLPTLTLDFVDTLNQMQFYGLQDGAQITVQLNSTTSLTRNYRVHSWTRAPAPQGFVYYIECYWDAPRYWVGSSCAGMKGTSSQVLEQICGETGLIYDAGNDNTADSMLWMPANKTWAEFAKSVARAGYISDTSHMALAVSSLGSMLYVDVNNNPEPKITVGYTPSGQGDFLMITDFTPKTYSGTNNHVGGYMHSRYVQTIKDSGSSVDNLEDELSFTPDAKYPLLSQDVRTRMKRGGVSYGHIDWGNVHDNYERARYQNARYNLLNSLTGEFLFPFQTSWEPFDNFNLALPADSDSTQYNGEYTVRDKIIIIQGTTYNEKIVAVKNGLGS